MDYGLLISAILSSAGIFGLVQFLIVRRDGKKNDLTEIKKELNSIKKELDDTNLRVTRTELGNLIRNYPENVDAILQLAEYYFIELDGNAYAHTVFEKWATDHNVAIGWLPKIKKGVKDGQKQFQQL